MADATVNGVLTGAATWACIECDAVAFVAALPDDSVDLLFTSPPYRKARTYGINAGRDTEEWVAWMMELVRAAAPKVRGLIAINCEGQTKDYRYHPTPFLLAADLHRAGFNLRKPCVFHRIGVPGGGGNRMQHEDGGGGADWLRNDWEPIICLSRHGKLPWADGTACGHAPKWAPGGECSNRLTDGARANDKEVPKWLREGMHTGAQNKIKLPRLTRKQKLAMGAKSHTKRDANTQGNGDALREQAYLPPVLANPGNVIHCNVGGGQMGSPLAHENEAPFPLDLPAFFVKSFCRPGGVVLDCFSGSGTTCHASVENGRRFVGCDLRDSQVELCKRRMRTVTPSMFTEDAA